MPRAAPRVSSIAVLALLLAACAGTRSAADLANLTDPRTIVDESANGTSVTIAQGSALVIRLPVLPGDAMQWTMQPIVPTEWNSPVRRDYAPDSGPATLPVIPPYSGVLAWMNPAGSAPPAGVSMRPWAPTPVVTSGANVFYLRGVAPGKATVQLDYQRPDQPAAPPAKSVRFDVAVQ